jgi:hypothetical protein
VFLATISPGATPDAPVISFTLNSPSASTNQEGRFVIGNLPAGTYSLAVWTPVRAILIPAPGGAKDSAIRVEIVNNRVTDLGVIQMERP